MKAAFKKTPAGLVPNCEEGQKVWDRIPIGGSCMVEHTEGRNPDNHRRFFKLRNETFEIQDEFTDPEIWRKHLLVMAGHFDLVIVPKPEWWNRAMKYLAKWLGGPQKISLIERLDQAMGIQMQAKSIAFDQMDETEFRELFIRVLNAFLERYAPEMDDQQFMRILEFD